MKQSITMNKNGSNHYDPISEHSLMMPGVSGRMDNRNDVFRRLVQGDNVNASGNAVDPAITSKSQNVVTPVKLSSLVVQEHHMSRCAAVGDMRTIPSNRRKEPHAVSPTAVPNKKQCLTFDKMEDEEVVVLESPKPIRLRDDIRVVSPVNQVKKTRKPTTPATLADNRVVETTPTKKLFTTERVAALMQTPSDQGAKKRRPRRKKQSPLTNIPQPPQPYRTVSVNPLMDATVQMGCLDLLSTIRKHEVFPFLFYQSFGNWNTIIAKTKTFEYKTLLEFEMDVSEELSKAMNLHHDGFSEPEVFSMMHELIHLFLNKTRWLKETLQQHGHVHSAELVEQHYNAILTEPCSDSDLVERCMLQELDLGYMVPMAPGPVAEESSNKKKEDVKVKKRRTRQPSKSKKEKPVVMTRFSPLARDDEEFIDSMEDLLEKEGLQFDQDKPKSPEETTDWNAEELLSLPEIGMLDDEEFRVEEMQEPREVSALEWDEAELMELPRLVTEDEELLGGDFMNEASLEMHMEQLVDISTSGNGIFDLVETEEMLLEEAVIDLNDSWPME